MARKTECYADTPAWIAFLDRSDSHHVMFRRLFADPPSLVTSALTVAEGHAWFLRRYDSYRALQFLQFLDALPHLRIVPFDASELASSAEVARRYADQKLTLADAHGLAILRQIRNPVCWSTDRRLTLGGARLVTA